MNNSIYDKYEEIDVPEFMKNRTKNKHFITFEEHEKEIKKAEIRGAFYFILAFIWTMIVIFVPAIIENML